MALPTGAPPTVKVTVPVGLMLLVWTPPGSWPDMSATMVVGAGSTARDEPALSTRCWSGVALPPSKGLPQHGMYSAVTSCQSLPMVMSSGRLPSSNSGGLTALPSAPKGTGSPCSTALTLNWTWPWVTTFSSSPLKTRAVILTSCP